MALLNDPDLLILDEPANGLDPAGIVEMRDLLRDLAASGKTVFISSHVLSEVQQICTRVAIINHGTLIRVAPVAELLEAPGEFEVKVDSPQRCGRDPAACSRGGRSARVEDGLVVTRAPEGRGPQPHRVPGPERPRARRGQRAARDLEDIFLSLTGETRRIERGTAAQLPRCRARRGRSRSSRQLSFWLMLGGGAWSCSAVITLGDHERRRAPGPAQDRPDGVGLRRARRLRHRLSDRLGHLPPDRRVAPDRDGVLVGHDPDPLRARDRPAAPAARQDAHAGGDRHGRCWPATWSSSGAILALLIIAWTGSLDPLRHISNEFWQDLGRWAVVQGMSMGIAILMAAAAAGIGPLAGLRDRRLAGLLPGGQLLGASSSSSRLGPQATTSRGWTSASTSSGRTSTSC